MRLPTTLYAVFVLALAATAGLAIEAVTAPAAATDDGFTGPKQGKGIANTEIGSIDLADEIPGMEGRHLRMRYWTVEPGGIVPLHSHANRPAMIYFLEGEIVQHRNDKPNPETYGPGDVSLESDGVVHWWENKGDVTVKMIAVDIVQRKK